MMLYERMAIYTRNALVALIIGAFLILIWYAIISVVAKIFWSYAPENIHISVIEKTNRLPVGSHERTEQ